MSTPEARLTSSNMAVAVLDILGYLDLIDRRGPHHVARVLDFLVTSSWPAQVQRDLDRYFRTGNQRAPQFGSAIASDTLFLYLPHPPQGGGLLAHPGDFLLSFCYGVGHAIARCLYAGIRLRGAVAYGEAFVSNKPTFVVGRPFVEAFKLEKDQDWIGAALCQSAEQALSTAEQGVRRHFVVPCSVPLKPSASRSFTPQYAVNWAGHIGTYIGATPPDWERLFPSSDDAIVSKRRNTIAFFDEFRSTGSPAYVSPSEDQDVWDRDDG